MREKRTKIPAMIAAAAGAVFLVLATLVACVEAVAFRPSFYKAEYDKLQTEAYVGADRETLDEATAVLLDYLQGRRETLDYRAKIGGTEREYYSDKEKLHMVDVAALNQNAAAFMAGAYPLGAALIVAAWFLCKKARSVLRSCFWGVLGTLAAFGALAAWAAADFGSFWVSFHHVFFTNDLWQLDPRTSLMIRMFEQTFFFDMVSRILAWFAGITLGALSLTGIAAKKLRSVQGL